ncbi:MAG: NAD(P)/FAD-dependent oxidoreductase [Chloroflexota bacterium]
MKTHYDVIVVGGRVAGSHLAARLGKYGFSVLLLERAELPSLPAVSSPVIYSSTMRMLDEVGADESAYAHNTPKLYHMTAVGEVSARLPIPEYKGRDYAYAIDRARFDAALWDTALSYENVDGYQGFSVTDLLWEGERVVGITGKNKNGDVQEFTSGVVVGADGRFGIVGRKANAEERDHFDTHPTSIYYAYWKNVSHEGGIPTTAAYEGADGTGYYAMDSADGQTVVGVEGRADAMDLDGKKAEAFYLDMIKRNPHLWVRMENAEMVTSVRGMRNIGNSYKQAGGAGWALVGDAYHQKDPLDGQGIYNAVVTGKALARKMLAWRKGELTWETMLAEYDEVARVKTYPMYKSLQSRIKGSFYASGQPLEGVPDWAQETLGRYLLEDKEVAGLLLKILTREIPPDMITLLAPPTLVGAVARGVRDDIANTVRKRLPFFNR